MNRGAPNWNSALRFMERVRLPRGVLEMMHRSWIPIESGPRRAHPDAARIGHCKPQPMKSAYELAMERLNQAAPTVKLTAAQKRELADLESRTKAKIAERELTLADEMAAARAAGQPEKVAELAQRLIIERKKLQAELEDKKERVRQGKQ